MVLACFLIIFLVGYDMWSSPFTCYESSGLYVGHISWFCCIWCCIRSFWAKDCVFYQHWSHGECIISIPQLQGGLSYFGTFRQIKQGVVFGALRLMRVLNRVYFWTGSRERVLNVGGSPRNFHSLKVNRSISGLKQARDYVPLDVLNTIYKSLIQPVFDYCDVVWDNLDQGL